MRKFVSLSLTFSTILAFSFSSPVDVSGQNFQQGQQASTPIQGGATVHWTRQLQTNQPHHDFGTVPSFSNQEHIFEFENPFDYPLHLVGIRASCGCTKPEILTEMIQPNETAKVLAKYDTRNFKGQKKATISVTVRRDQPYIEYGEIQFSVKGKIRRDVVLNPGTVSFDDVTLGSESVRSVQILYAGNPAWKIQSIKSSNPNLIVESKEIQRDQTTKRVDYELSIQLSPDQQVGSFADQLLITTNDVKNKTLTVNVQGNVKSVVQVSPVRLGVITKDQKIQKKLIVRGAHPFEIRSISTDDSRIKFDTGSGSKTLHILSYTLDTSNIGMVSSKIQIQTDDPNQKMAEVNFEAQIVPGTYALDANASK